MALPATLSTGARVASLRQAVAVALPGLRRRLGLAARLPGEYRSAFPPRLRAWRFAIVALALLWLALGLLAVAGTATIVRVVGHDTAPSVAAAERIRTGLASANADFALATLAGEGVEGAFLADMRRQLRGVNAALVAAGGNVTYGDEERGPIATALQGLGDYEQIVGRSVTSLGDARRDLAFAADDLLHWTVLPAAATLERVNADHLASDFAAYLGGWSLPWLVLASALLLAALAAAQLDIARTTRRILNPGLALATLAALAATATAVAALVSARADLVIAKHDAFDSVYALSTTDAVATDFDAGQSFLLLADGDAGRQARYAAANAFRARRLLVRDAAAVAAATGTGRAVSGDDGLIGDELANVTFPGERQAALDLLNAWGAVLQSDAALRADLARGRRSLVVAARTADVSGGTRALFVRFDAALAKVLGINETAFADGITRAEEATRPLGPVLVAGFVSVVAAAWFGIRRRLDAYRF